MTDTLYGLKWQSPLLDIIELQDIVTKRENEGLATAGSGKPWLTGFCG